MLCPLSLDGLCETNSHKPLRCRLRTQNTHKNHVKSRLHALLRVNADQMKGEGTPLWTRGGHIYSNKQINNVNFYLCINTAT